MKFGPSVVKRRKLILVLSLLLLIPSFIGMKATRINYDMLTYLPKDMETVQGQDLLLEDFGKGGFSIVVTENMKSNDITKLKTHISRVPHVDSIINLQEVMNPSVPVEFFPSMVKKNIGNENASMMVVFFDTTTSSEETLEAVEKIREISNENTFIAGMSSLVVDLKTLCEKEETKYVSLAVILSLLAMMLLLDSYVAPIIFMASIGMAILYNLGTNIFLGEISYITKAIAAVLQLGVTMDYSIFLWHSYVEKREEHIGYLDAMGEAINATLASVTGSSITTVAGFLALCFMSYTMGMDLGIVMAKGVIFGVLCSVTVLPVFILSFHNIVEKTRHKALIPKMNTVAHRLTQKYAIYMIIFAILLIPAIHGYNNDYIVYDFTKMMANSSKELSAEDTPFMTANEKLKENFNIGTSYMVLTDADLPAKEGKALSNQINNLEGVTSIFSLDHFMGTSIPKEILPDKLINGFVAKNHQIILVNSQYSVSSKECNHQIREVNRIAKKYDDKAMVIGEGPATKDLIKITDKDFKVVNWISIGLVFLIILFVLQSATLPIILVAVIEFAIFANLGISGYTGLELPFIVPICISTIQLGSTVDYAILLSTRYKKERISGRPKREAIEVATSTSIPSIVVSAFGFFTATFGVSIYSDISIISTFCTLMARGAIISMFTVILLLPSLLMALDKVICKTTRGMTALYLKNPSNIKKSTM